MPDAGFSLRRMLREKPLWILIACIVVYVSPALLGSTFFFRDLYLLFYGKRLLLAEALRHGDIPLWDPTMQGGQPFIGMGGNTVYYPLNLFFLILPPLTAFNLLMVVQFVLCAFFSYFLGRAFGLSTLSSFVTGAVFTFSGIVLSSANLLVLFQGMAWAPALIGFVHLLMRERRKRWLVASALSGAIGVLGGGAEIGLVSLALAIAWMLIVPGDIPFVKRAITAAIVFAFAFGLSLMQTLPVSEVIRYSSRAEPRDYISFTQWSVAPQRLPELVIPRFFGRTDTLARRDYWGARYEYGFPYLISIYFGVSTLLLAFAGLTTDLLPRRGRIILGAFIGVGVILCMGAWLPFFPFLYAHVPRIGVFRFPVKALEFTLIPITLAAGAGFEALPRKRLIAGGAIAAAVLAIVTVAFRGAIARALFDPMTAADSAEFARSFVHATIAAALIAAACAWNRRMAIAVVVLLDLVFAGAHVNAYAPRELFNRPVAADKVQPLLDDGGRLYRTGDPYVQQITAPSNENVWLAWWDIQVLARYTAATFGIPLVFHDDYDGLAPIWMVRMRNAMEKLPWNERLNVLSAAGASAILTPDVIASPDVERVQILRSPSGAPLYLYRNRAARPLRFATGAIVIRDDKSAFQRLASKPFDPNIVILSEGTAAPPRQNNAAVKTLRRSMNSCTAEVNSESPGYVVFAQTWYPGWRTTVDGHPAPLLRADVGFSAVAVPAGHHLVEKTYRPPLVPAGLAGSAVTALILAFWRFRQ